MLFGAPAVLLGALWLGWYEYHELSPRRGEIRAFVADWFEAPAEIPERPARTPIVATPTVATDPGRPCSTPIASRARLSDWESCALEILRDRCAPRDICLVDCLANEKHRFLYETGEIGFVAGGCFHYCSSYRGQDPWQEPQEWERCDALDNSIPDRVRHSAPSSSSE